MPSRRELISLDADEQRRFLEASKTIILVSNGPGGFPHPMPMWFHVDEAGRVLCTTFAKAQKVKNLERDPRATLLAESGAEYSQLKGLVLYCDVELIPETDFVTETLVNISTRGGTPSEAERAKAREVVGKTAPKRVALRFTPRESVSWDHAKLGGRY